jgi:predicted glycoside hydrolase/deacetylase ChbG (UPF0249 family)
MRPAASNAGPVTVIINADDFAMNQLETEATCQGMDKGRITSATIMANGAALPQALQYARGASECSFGVHLNLTQGAPIAGGSGARLLVDHTGRMTRQSFMAIRPTRAFLRAIYEEWCGQVNLVVSSGVSISHFDSHNHIHTIPFLFPVLKAVQKRFGIRRVRISKNIYSKAEPCAPLLRIKKLGYNFALRNIYSTRTTSGFTDLTTFCEVARQGRVGYKTVELMIHPKSKGGEAEDALLYSDWEGALQFPIVKTHYGRL